MTSTQVRPGRQAPLPTGPGAAAWADTVAGRELRAEVRAVLTGPGSRAAWRALAEEPGPQDENDPRPLYRLLGRHRLLAPNWPRCYGGRGLPASATAIVVEEMIAAGMPEVLHTLSVQICGNFLLSAGTPEQRAAMLPGMAAGSQYCTVLYTEPAVGSDLASLATRAEPDPDGGWLITGRKLYSVRAWLADVGLVAVRTHDGASPYQGVTLFLVPLDAPGVTVAVLPSLADEAFVDARLSRVRVSDSQAVGGIGDAWPLITAALALERTGVDFVAKAETWLRAWCRDVTTGQQDMGTGQQDMGTGQQDMASGQQDMAAGQPDMAVGQIVTAAEHAAQAGRLWTRIQAGRALSSRCVAGLDTGQVDPVGAAVTKLWTSETAREVAWWCAGALHERGLPMAGDPAAAVAGRLEAAYREAPGLTIQAGTSEMMCELIAAAGLPSSAIGAGQPGPPPLAGDDAQLIADLCRAVRWAVSSPQQPPAEAGPAADWELLASFGIFALTVPAAAGGYGIGCHAALAVATELGAAGYDGGILDTLTAVDALAAAPESPSAREHLDQLLAGRRAAALADPGRPLRPVPDPGPGGLLLIIAADDQPRAGSPAGHLVNLLTVGPRFSGPGLAARRLLIAGDERPAFTVGLTAAAQRAAVPLCEGADAQTVVAADLLRRAAWLVGAGAACVAAAVRRARTRQQFGQALIDNQVVGFRLARLSAHAQALGALVSELGAAHSMATATTITATAATTTNTATTAAATTTNTATTNTATTAATRTTTTTTTTTGTTGQPPLAAAAGALAEAGRFAEAAAREAVQLHGAFGMVKGSPAEPYYRRIRTMIAQAPPPWILDRLAAAALSPGLALDESRPGGHRR